jgi:single-strand DNA-binding protein
MGIANYCNFIGHLGADPIVRETKGETPMPVANFSVAVNEKFGNNKEVTTWIDVVTFRTLADTASKRLHKGSFIAVSGRLQNRKWQDKDGNDRYSTEIIANSMRMLDKKPAAKGEEDLPGVDQYANDLPQVPAKQVVQTVAPVGDQQLPVGPDGNPIF